MVAAIFKIAGSMSFNCCSSLVASSFFTLRLRPKRGKTNNSKNVMTLTPHNVTIPHNRRFSKG